MQGNIEELLKSEEPLSFYQKSQLDFLKQCRLLNIEVDSAEAEKLRKTVGDPNNNNANAITNNIQDNEVKNNIN